jgi:hypothetical protein
MATTDCLITFRQSIVEANGFVALAFQQDAAGAYLLPASQRDFITDSAFLKMFIAWETFMENIVINYMLGEPSINGTAVVRYVQPVDSVHAHKMIIGTQKYMDWSNPELVQRICNNYFVTGNHIDTFLGSIYRDLIDLKTIRNAAAHLSTTTGKHLDSLASRLLGSTQSNTKVSGLIFSIDPSSATSDTFLSTYLAKLDIAAEGIATG